jgi:hypothetical protein
VFQGVEHFLDQIRFDDGDDLFHAPSLAENRAGGKGHISSTEFIPFA